MRCRACDQELQDHETRRKGLFTGEYMDLCDGCFNTIADDVYVADGDPDVDRELTDLAEAEKEAEYDVAK